MNEINVGSWTASRCAIGEFFKMYLQELVDEKKIETREAAKSHMQDICDVAVEAGDMTAAECEEILQFCTDGIRFLPDTMCRVKRLNHFICHLVDHIACTKAQAETSMKVMEDLGLDTNVFTAYCEAQKNFEEAKSKLMDLLRPAVVKRIKEFVLKYQAKLDKDFVRTCTELV